jgi:hypothetical protein
MNFAINENLRQPISGINFKAERLSRLPVIFLPKSNRRAKKMTAPEGLGLEN